MTSQPQIRVAMVGGGPGSFIGAVHRAALRLDGRYRLVAGAFSRDLVQSRSTASELGLASDRAHCDYVEMLDCERAIGEGGAELVVIATPNDTHRSIAAASLARSFNVFCEKPLARDLADAEGLPDEVARHGKTFGLAYTYSGYPLVHQARMLIAQGHIGAVRRVMVDYAQGWLAKPLELNPAQRQAIWRTDPQSAGPGGAIADIGSHAQHLLEFVSGQDAVSVSARLRHMVTGRRTDDDAAVLIRLSNGAEAGLSVTQVAIGEANNISIRVYGDEGSLSWRQEVPDQLWLTRAGRPTELWRAGSDVPYLDPSIRALCRTPAGHPEGYLEAFANLYRQIADQIRGPLPGQTALPPCPGIDAGLRGMQFIAAVIASDAQDGAWTDVGITR